MLCELSDSKPSDMWLIRARSSSFGSTARVASR